jgi:putative solute:sodium symporter small subunit
VSAAPDPRQAGGPALKLARRRHRYWRRNLRLTIGLLVLWFGVTFIVGWYAAELNQFSFLGFPVGFYAFAQGGPLVFLAIIFVYVRYMNRLDRSYGDTNQP